MGRGEHELKLNVRGAQKGSGVLPNFIIIGAMRSGTTSLARYLGAHPDVFMAPAKEVHYFDQHFEKGIEWYKTQFSGATTEQAVGEATPIYMNFEEVPGRMAAVVPQARLIAILRNPVDRAYSHYWRSRALGREKLEFVDAIAQEPERLATGDYWMRRHYSYIDKGLYLKQFLHVCEFYPREALLVVFFEELRDAPRETFQSVCRFLQLDDGFVPPQLGAAANHFVRFRSGMLRDVHNRLPPPFRPVRRIVRRLNIQASSYPPMDSAVRAELQARYEADNAALASWLGRDLSIWKA